jgi:tetratricopeptide (TPR) repeat protein
MGSLVLLFALGVADAPAIAANPESAGVRARAFDLAYNLDHDEAVALLRKTLEYSPNDPSLHRALASILWLNMLFRRGAITVDHYLGSFSRTQIELKKPPPDLDTAFRSHVARAIELAEQRVAATPRDPQAHFDLGAAVGLHSSYVATVEGRMMAGFTGARRAFNAHEKVLELDPNRKDAGLVIGTYRYIVSTLSLPMRMMAYVVGFGGGRERGIQLLQETAAQRGEMQTDALFALVLVYNRERQFDAALKALDELRRMYPRNRLVVLEAGSTALRAGRFAQADALLTEGLGILAREKRERIPGEEMLWRYKRGAARAGLGQTGAALADLRAATHADAPSWVSGRAHTELARLSLAGGDRKSAASQASRAETLCAAGNDPACVEQARRLLKQAGTPDGR